MRNLFLLLTICFGNQYSFAQFSTGMYDDEEVLKQYNSLDRAPSPGSKSGEASLDGITKIDLSEFAPSVGHQGNIGSCVGWSVSSALTISNAIENEWSKSEIEKNALSALYIYNNIKKFDCPQGSSLYDAGRWLVKYGDCKRAAFDTNVEDCNKKSDKSCKNPEKFKIQDFMPLFHTKTPGKDKVFQTRLSLADSIPVVIGMTVLENFFKPAGEKWDPTVAPTTSAGGHAMCVVGFSDAKKSFKVMNSWGKDWGNDGFIWVKYNDFMDHCKYAYQYIIKEQDPEVDEPVEDPSDEPSDEPVVSNETVITGKFDFEYFTFDDDDNPVSNVLGAKYKSGYKYDLAKEDWEFGDLFRFIIKNVPKQRYVYAFSKDASGLSVHYPRGIEFDEEDGLFGAGESPIVKKREDIFVPTPTTALTREERGEDHVCVLYSSDKIEDYKTRLLKVKNSDLDFETAINEAFGDILISAKSIDYKEDSMSFKASSNGEKIVVPIYVTMKGD